MLQKILIFAGTMAAIGCAQIAPVCGYKVVYPHIIYEEGDNPGTVCRGLMEERKLIVGTTMKECVVEILSAISRINGLPKINGLCVITFDELLRPPSPAMNYPWEKGSRSYRI